MVILWDYFGVIASDAYWYAVKAEENNNGNAKHIADLSDDVNIGRLSWKDFCAQVAADLKISEAEVENRYSKHNINRQVATIIREMKQQGFYIALASNASSDHLRPMMFSTHLDELFDEVFFSSDIGYAKPDKRFFTHIFKSLNVKPNNCLLIDDSMANVQAAEDLGMSAICFTDAERLTEALKELMLT